MTSGSSAKASPADPSSYLDNLILELLPTLSS